MSGYAYEQWAKAEANVIKKQKKQLTLFQTI